MNQIATEFLAHCFAPTESIALLLRKDDGRTPTQRVVLLEQALAPRYLGWLAHENRNGANIYVAANPLRSGSRKRTKQSIAKIRYLYIDIDTDGESRLSALRASASVPTPTAILSTSPDKYQVLWRVDGFDFERQEQTLKLLTVTFGGDPACTDCNRVLRLPGFLNRKYNPAPLVTVEYPSDSVSNPRDFRLEIRSSNAEHFDRATLSRNRSGKRSNSETDWAWICHELTTGNDPAKLTRELASRRSDKPNPLYYAQRTVDIASARLWLREGIPVSDVVTMLESRRRFEISPALCSARAYEIALTAQRMIMRKTIA
ncbi:MAG TPA: RepB family DNA primase [Terracidiphilus sp.]|jgi:hypothetical protein